MNSRPNAGPPGFSLVEVIVALAVFVTGSLCMITATHAAMVRSEINRLYQVSMYDSQAVIEQISGLPYDNICKLGQATAPTFPQGPVDILNRLGFDPTNPIQQHLGNEKIYVFYFPDSINQANFQFVSENTLRGLVGTNANAGGVNFTYYVLNTGSCASLTTNSGTVNLTVTPDPMRFSVVVFFDSPFIDPSSWSGFKRIRYDVPFMVTQLCNDQRESLP